MDCVSCKFCGGDITIKCENIFGLSERICVLCNDCGEIASSRNSSMLGKRKNQAEINSRFIYAMRTLGQSLAAAKTFCGVMDLP